MGPKDFAKYRMKRPEGQTLKSQDAFNESSLFGIGYGISADKLLEMFPLEDRPTVEEAQRLHGEFNRCFPALSWKIDEIRKEALLKFAPPKKGEGG